MKSSGYSIKIDFLDDIEKGDGIKGKCTDAIVLKGEKVPDSGWVKTGETYGNV